MGWIITPPHVSHIYNEIMWLAIKVPGSSDLVIRLWRLGNPWIRGPILRNCENIDHRHFVKIPVIHLLTNFFLYAIYHFVQNGEYGAIPDTFSITFQFATYNSNWGMTTTSFWLQWMSKNITPVLVKSIWEQPITIIKWIRHNSMYCSVGAYRAVYM